MHSACEQTVQLTDLHLEKRNIYLRRNYAAHTLDGGIYMGALALVDANTLLPDWIRTLGGPTWLISLMPTLMFIGFLSPPIFTAHLIERLHRYKPVCLCTGVFQRLPYLVAGLLLLLVENKLVGICAIAMAPLISGMFGGMSLTAWQQLLIRTVPGNRRSSVFASRYVVACVVGLVCGWMVKTTLSVYPGVQGFGFLFLGTFLLLLVSLSIFAGIRETNVKPPEKSESVSFFTNVKSYPAIIGGDRNLQFFLIGNMLHKGMFIVLPFLAIHAREVLSQPESFLGELQMAFMVGAFLGNMVAGWVGDRFGSKSVVMSGSSVFLVMAAVALFAQSSLAFLLVFVLFGMAFYGISVGVGAMALQICPEENRVNYLAIMAVINIPALLVASGTSALLWRGPESFPLVTLVAVGCIIISMIYFNLVKEEAPGQSNARPERT